MATPVQDVEQSSDQIDDRPAKRAERTSRSPLGPRRTTGSALLPDPSPAPPPAEPPPAEPPEPVPASPAAGPSELPPPVPVPVAPLPSGGVPPALPEPDASTYSSALSRTVLRPSGANTATEYVPATRTGARNTSSVVLA